MKEILSPSNLFEANELYQAVMGTNPNGIFIYDLDGNLLDCNEAACKMHEMDKEEILKLSPRDFIHPDGFDTFKRFQQELKTTGEFTGESSGLTKSGRKFDVEVYGKLVHIRNNSYLYSTVKDITKQKYYIQRLLEQEKNLENTLYKTQQRLLAQERLASIGSLMSGIAHEVKNPLNIIINATLLIKEFVANNHEVLQRAFSSNPKKLEEFDDVQTMLGLIEASGERADSIIQSMLNQLRSKKSTYEVTDIRKTLSEAIELIWHQNSLKKSAINLKIERNLGDCGLIEAYPHELTRVFINLLDNSIYSISKKMKNNTDSDYHPLIKVTLRREPSAIKASIWDNGVGIKRDDQDKIFQQFFTTKPPGEGTGIGLSLVYDIVTKLHGGKINVESEPGRHALFTIELPTN